MRTIATLKEHYILKGVRGPEYYLRGNVEQTDEHWIKDGVCTVLWA
jgi:hypothetical protein